MRGRPRSRPSVTVFWLDPSLAGTQIGVATTSMLTLIAYRFTIDGYIPKVAYLTRLDSFILSSTILVFVALVLAVLTSYLAANDERSRAMRIERHCRCLSSHVLVQLRVMAARLGAVGVSSHSAAGDCAIREISQSVLPARFA